MEKLGELRKVGCLEINKFRHCPNFPNFRNITRFREVPPPISQPLPTICPFYPCSFGETFNGFEACGDPMK